MLRRQKKRPFAEYDPLRVHPILRLTRLTLTETRKGIPKKWSSQVLGEVPVNFLG